MVRKEYIKREIVHDLALTPKSGGRYIYPAITNRPAKDYEAWEEAASSEQQRQQ
jgi:hypothetical protein